MCLTPYSCLMLPPVTIGKNTKPFSLFCRLQQWVVRALRWMGHWNTSFPMTKNSTTSEKQGWILLILLTKALPLYKFALYHLCKFTPRNKISLAPLLHAWPKIFQLDGITYSFHSHNIFKSTCNCLFPSQVKCLTTKARQVIVNCHTTLKWEAQTTKSMYHSLLNKAKNLHVH